MRIFLLSICLSLCGSVSPAFAEEGDKRLVNDLLKTTSLGENLKTLEDYYSEINRQLDKGLHKKNRDPFVKKNYARPAEAVNKSLFIPNDSLESLQVDTRRPGNGSANSDSSALLNSNALPKMQFKGFMKSGSGKAGLLDVEGQGTFVVHEGDQVGLRQSNGETVIRVVEINALNLIIEFGSIGAKVVVQ